MQTREFGGASGQVTHQVFYGDGTSGNAIAAAGLIDPIHRDALAALISTGVAKVGIALDAQPPRGDAAMALLTDLAVTPSGDLVAHLDQGVLAPYSAGNLTITVERDKSAPLLSAFGRSVAAAVTGVVPYAAPADSGSSSGSSGSPSGSPSGSTGGAAPGGAAPGGVGRLVPRVVAPRQARRVADPCLIRLQLPPLPPPPPHQRGDRSTALRSSAWP
ncbi:MAG: hypothetical protein V9F04_17280 [Dermatophilaceae bacterium]